MSEITLRILVRRNENEGPVIMGCVGSDYDREFVAECGIDSIGVPEYGLWVWEGWGEAYQGAEDSYYLLYGEFRPALTSDLPQFVQSNRKELIPHHLIHPGQILKRELESRGLGVEALKKGFPWVSLLDGNAEINIRTALAIEQTLGITADFWLNAQLKYDRWVLAKMPEAGNVLSQAGETFHKSMLEGAARKGFPKSVPSGPKPNNFCYYSFLKDYRAKIFAQIVEKLIPGCEISTVFQNGYWGVMVRPAESDEARLSDRKFNIWEIGEALIHFYQDEPKP